MAISTNTKAPLACLGRVAALLGVLLPSIPISADSILLRTGEKLIGQVIEQCPATVVFQSEALGRIEVPSERIEKLEVDSASPARAPLMETAWERSALMNRFVPWQTPTGSDAFDWIQLKSGEWLKGRLISLQNDRLEFDSEKMDREHFDWKDIHTVRLPRPSGVRFENLGAARGKLLVTTNQVIIIGQATNAYPRSKLISITPTGMKERNLWSGDVSAGLAFRSGNTRQFDYNAQFDIDRRSPFTHLQLDYLGNLGKIEDTESVNNHRVSTQFDYFVTRRLFLITPFVEYYRDQQQNLEHRLTAGVGAGYDLIRRHRLEWNVIAGPAYQQNWYTSLSASQGDPGGAGALVLGSEAKLELTRRLDLHSEVRAQITRRDVGASVFHSGLKLEFEIHKRLNLDISFTWDRISDPRTDANGVTPEKDDFRLITGLGVRF